MKKFEYRVEGIDVKNFNEDKTILEIKNFLSKVGLEGWELVGMTPTFQWESSAFTGKELMTKKGLLIFKREIE